MREKNNSIRMDLLGRKTYLKTELIRVSILKTGETTIDWDQVKLGRGIYFHINSLQVILDRKILEKQINKYEGDFSSIKQELFNLKNERET